MSHLLRQTEEKLPEEKQRKVNEGNREFK